MSRVRVYLGCSLDGCIAGPDHDLSFLEAFGPDPEAPETGLSFHTFLADVGVILMGRRTYQVVLDFDTWHYGDVTVLVATHRELPAPPAGGRALGQAGTIQELVARALHLADGRDVYLDGGDLVRQGLEAGLVDEITLTFLPVILGRGVRLWDGLLRTTALDFAPPVLHGGRLVQVTAQVRR